MACKNSYKKIFEKNGKEMIFCHLFDDKKDDALILCNFERYCGIKHEYIFEKPERCRFYSEE
jgi:hypothetical protein